MILSVSIVLVSLLRKKSAGLRHLVLSVFLIGLLFLPILSTITTGWETRLLPAWQTRDAAALNADGLIRNMNDSSMALGATFVDYEVSKHVEAQKNSRSFFSLFLSELKPLFGFAMLLIWALGSMFLFIRIIFGL